MKRMTDDRRDRQRGILIFTLVPLLVLSAVLVDVAFFYRPPSAPTPAPLVPGTTPINRVIVVMKENHAFDNYFGSFPGADGPPPNVSLPDGSGGTVSPTWIDAVSTPDLPHSRSAMIQSYDGGLNDQFAVVANAARPGLGSVSLGYYDGRQLPATWALARNFTLADRYFQSMFGPTLPNRLYSIAGQAGGVTGDALPVGGIDMSTIFDQLQSRGISWRYYAFNDFLNRAIPLDVNHIANDPTMASNVVPMSQLGGDLVAGNLPSVTFIDPEGDLPGDLAINDHPPGSVASGDAWTASVVAAVMGGPMWSRSAILLTWDESGGFYDHVPPEQVDALGYGFRVPMLVISPYAKRGFVDHDVMDHTSILKFIATNWELSSLTPREANASDMFSAFSFPNGTVAGYSAEALRLASPMTVAGPLPTDAMGLAVTDSRRETRGALTSA